MKKRGIFYIIRKSAKCKKKKKKNTFRPATTELVIGNHFMACCGPRSYLACNTPIVHTGCKIKTKVVYNNSPEVIK